MMIDETLLSRIRDLNERGISCFEIAKLAGVQPGTVRRFVDGISTRMEETTHTKIAAAVAELEDGNPVDSPSYEESPVEKALPVMWGVAFGMFLGFLFFAPWSSTSTIEIHKTIEVVHTVRVVHCIRMIPAPVESSMDSGSSGGASGGDGGGTGGFGGDAFSD